MYVLDAFQNRTDLIIIGLFGLRLPWYDSTWFQWLTVDGQSGGSGQTVVVRRPHTRSGCVRVQIHHQSPSDMAETVPERP